MNPPSHPSQDTKRRSSSGAAQRPSSTRERLLDAAEALFADRGLHRTSLRALTERAGANLAAVHYHFGSKEDLVEAVLRRRLVPINAERLQLLSDHEREAGENETGERGTGDSPVAIEKILDAFLGPPFRRAVEPDYADFIRFMGRIFSEPSDAIKKVIPQQFGEVIERFGRALSRALPHLEPREVMWRFHFMVGSMVHVIVDPARLRETTGGLCDPADSEATLAQLSSFLSAGMRAPSASAGDAGEER